MLGSNTTRRSDRTARRLNPSNAKTLTADSNRRVVLPPVAILTATHIIRP